MSLDFLAIDFETANEKRASICAVALILFEDSRITNEFKWIVSPPQHLNYFKPINIKTHGITESDVIGKPEFNQLWHEIYPLINNRVLVAHNAGFDISVLQQLIDHYELDYPSIEFVCTCSVARKTWDKQINYTLKNIGNSLGYIFNHHDPHDDARICGHILLDACRYHDSDSIEDLTKKIGMRKGSLSCWGYRSCSISNPYHGLRRGRYETIDVDQLSQEDIETDGAFLGKNVVFTGTLISMTRTIAAQKVIKLGGHPSENLNKHTNLLVEGILEKPSDKIERARSLIEKGYPLEVIDEDDFLRMMVREKQEHEY